MSTNVPDPSATESTEGKAPEFDGEFDAEKAQRLVANLRGDIAALKTERDSIKEERDGFKAAAEKTGEDREKALTAALERAEAAERTLALAKHSLPEDILAEFADYLTGTPEEVDAKAAKLAARFVPKEQGSEETPPVVEEPPAANPVVPERPKAALVPGHGSEIPAVFDPVAIAKSIRS